MAQLRRDYDQFQQRNVAVLVVGPEKAPKFESYFAENDLPFIGLPDPGHSVLKRYGQEVNLFKLGRMPAQVLIDREGVARFAHYGASMQDIPSTGEMLALIDRLRDEEKLVQA